MTFSLCSLKQQISHSLFFEKIANLGSKEIYIKKKNTFKESIWKRSYSVLICSMLFPMNSTCTMCNLSITVQITSAFGKHWKKIYLEWFALAIGLFFGKMFVLCFILGEISINCSIWIIFIINIISILNFCFTQFKMQNVITEPWKTL